MSSQEDRDWDWPSCVPAPGYALWKTERFCPWVVSSPEVVSHVPHELWFLLSVTQQVSKLTNAKPWNLFWSVTKTTFIILGKPQLGAYAPNHYSTCSMQKSRDEGNEVLCYWKEVCSCCAWKCNWESYNTLTKGILLHLPWSLVNSTWYFMSILPIDDTRKGRLNEARSTWWKCCHSNHQNYFPIHVMGLLQKWHTILHCSQQATEHPDDI